LIPLFDLSAQHAEIRPELDAAVAGVFAHGRYLDGPEVPSFEEAYAAYCGSSYCVGVANGTIALSLALRAAGIGPGDEVITTAMTFIATAASIVETGATSVLADPNLDTGVLDVEAVEAAITPRTAAVVPVHLWGQTVDLDAFRALADRHGLFLLEDAAQAHGATWNGRRAGSAGDAATFSFYPGKNLGAAGDAGAITTADESLAQRLRRLRDHGRLDKYRHGELGTNARLDTLQAAVLEVKLRHLDAWNERRREHAAVYDAAFSGVEGVEPIAIAAAAGPIYHQYVVRCSSRDEVVARCEAAGIGTGVHYPLALHQQPALADLALPQPLPTAERLAAEVLSLPISPTLSETERAEVIAAVSG
jgi:dTDP-4-amino-4,6-dideoxygalactose transaminase